MVKQNMYVPVIGTTSTFHLFCKYPILLLVLPIIAGIAISGVPATDRCPMIGMVSFTFDDGFVDTLNIAYPILAQYGYTGTAYIPTGLMDTESGYYMTTTDLQILAKAGWEIGSHGVNHYDLTTLDAATLTHELANSKTVLQVLGFNVQTIASPYGAYNTGVLVEIEKYYYGHRTAQNTPILNNIPVSDRYQIRGWVITNDTSVQQVEQYVKKAMDERKWLVLVFHKFDREGTYSYKSADFAQIVKYTWTLGYSALKVYTTNYGLSGERMCAVVYHDADTRRG